MPTIYTVKVSAVNAKGPGKTRCRAGLKFSPEATEHEVTAEQLKQIQADPVLNCTVLGEVEAEADEKKRLNAKDTIEAIRKAGTEEELLACWTDGEERQSVVEAFNKRYYELEAAKK